MAKLAWDSSGVEDGRTPNDLGWGGGGKNGGGTTKNSLSFSEIVSVSEIGFLIIKDSEKFVYVNIGAWLVLTYLSTF